MNSGNAADPSASPFIAFEHHPTPMRVSFGPGVLTSLPDLLDTVNMQRLLVLSSPGRRGLADQVAALIGGRCAALFAGALQHAPSTVVEQARAEALAGEVDGVIAVGGGSTTGLAKALALDADLPYVAIPTSYAGSEMTPIWGTTKHGQKQTGRNPAVLPRAVVYDVNLTLTLPVLASVSSGMNAIAHAVEALYAPDRSPFVSLMAQEGVRRLAAALPAIANDPHDVAARGEALYGAWLCGSCLGATTMSLHHKLCHVLGGTVGLSHAETHTVVLPHVLALNAASAPFAIEALAQALGAPEPAVFLQELGRRLGAPRSLRDLGMTSHDVNTVARLVVAQPYANPMPVTLDDVRTLLDGAYRGATVTETRSVNPVGPRATRKQQANQT